MARSINTITLLGNVGQTPEKIGSGENVGVRFSVATAPGWAPEKTEWHNVVAWRKLAEIILQYVTKGAKIMVIGRLTYNQWTDKDGNKRTQAQIAADDVVFLDSRPTGDSNPEDLTRKEAINAIHVEHVEKPLPF